MTRRRIIPVILAALLIPAAAPLRADVSSQLRSGNGSLQSGHPLDALASYRVALTDPMFRSAGSPELWYNVGLAEKKTGDAAAASLSFRRSLLLDPTYLPARRQLAEVLGTLGFAPDSGWRESLRSSVHPELLVVAGSVIGWIGVFLTVLLFFLSPQRKLAIAFALVLAILGHGVSALGTLVDPRRLAADEAVVTSKKPQVLRATPADSGTPEGTLPPGTLVCVLSRNGAWWYVSGDSGTAHAPRGWIHSDSITPLLPSDSFAKGF